ncbi:MAG: chromosome partitioning protein ParA [Okeania sp. SIO3I5]|uniref:chromosome partitioning protein ParA n=1 Tax=Okeania sp. SIO3I5 TaxID=2607805 RepID=UPI0013B72A25|nr:chromosome partitioning protein ParA [Okeania sp. SIO3I5]NEQ35517.1 chromosome partitioning protein ParA [Okeania sp. SIO3I5]
MTHKTEKSTLIISSMYSSGSSLTASMLKSAGLHIGRKLMEEKENNTQGYFENLDFYEFHKQVLQSQGIDGDGWTLQEKIDIEENFQEKAKEIIAKNSISGNWGWKEPRTTLFLDFWADLLPNAKFILIYRSPWEVVNSLYIRQDKIFKSQPELAVKLWLHYNQKIIDFYNHAANRCLLTNIQTIINNQEVFIEKINQKFQTNFNNFDVNIYNPSLFNNQVSTESHRPTIIDYYFPEATEMYQELEARAWKPEDEIPDFSWQEKIKSSPYRIWAFQDWMNLSSLENQNKTLLAELEKYKNQYEQSQLELTQAKSELTQTRDELEKYITKVDATETKLLESQKQLGNTEKVLAETQGKLQTFEHIQVKFDQTENELATAKFQLNQTQTELRECQSKLQHTESELKKYQGAEKEFLETKSKLHEIQGELVQYQSQLHQTQEELEQYIYRVQETESLWQKSKSQLEKSEELLDKFNSQEKQNQAELGKTKQNLYETQTKLKICLHQLHQTQEDWEKDRSQLTVSEAMLQKFQSQLQETKLVLAQSNSQLKQIEAQEQQTQSKLKEKETRLQQLEAEFKEIKTSQNEWEISKSQLHKTKQEWQRSQLQIQELQTELVESNSQLQQTETLMEKSHAQLQQTKALLTEFQTQLHQTDEERENMQMQLQETQAVLQEVQTQWRKTEVLLQQSQSQQQNAQKELVATKSELEKLQYQQAILRNSKSEGEGKTEYQMLVWEAWFAYQNDNLAEMQERLQKSLKYTESSRTEIVMEWLDSFANFSQTKGIEFDSEKLTNSEEWQNLMKRAMRIQNKVLVGSEK